MQSILISNKMFYEVDFAGVINYDKFLQLVSQCTSMFNVILKTFSCIVWRSVKWETNLKAI